MPSAATPTLNANYTIDARDDPFLGVTAILGLIGPTTLCAINPFADGVLAYWLEQATCAAAAEWIERRTAAGENVYYVLNLPQQGLAKKPAKAEILELRGLAADIDAKNGRSLDDALAAIDRVGITPTLVVATGGGFQPIWMLRDPLPATEENSQRVEAIGARIMHLTRGDPIQNIDRILRLPFTRNFPNKTKIEAGRVVCCSGLLLPKYGVSDG
jgi:hypothetical protein